MDFRTGYAVASVAGGEEMTPYYEESGITIYHGDCREILPELTVDCVVTDPPYGIGFPYQSYDDTAENLEELIDEIQWAFLTSNRACVLCGPTQINVYPRPSWVASVVWNTTGSFGRRGYNQWTPVLCYGSDVEGFGSVNGMLKSDVIKISGGAGVGFQRGGWEKEHTCPKPQNIMHAVVQRFTEMDDIVIDPFMGSGTTLVAAKNLGRQAIGIEIEEKYCEIAAQRLAQGVLNF
jgi:site-specific DNA-methyltransferase (adenine-specific)